MRVAIRAALSLLKATFVDAAGCSAKFWKLSDEVGLKYYPYNIPTGYLTFKIQEIMAENGLAPQCWGYCEHGECCAYFTETVKVANDSSLDYDKIWRGYDELNTTVKKRWNNLIMVDDLHEGNYGFDKNGKPVIIDFNFVKYRNDQNEMWTVARDRHLARALEIMKS